MPEWEIKKIDSPDNWKEEINKSEQLKLDKMDPELVAKKLEDQEKAKDEKQKKVLDVFDHSPSAKLQTVDQYKNNIQILVNGLNSWASWTQEMNNAFVDYKDKDGKITIPEQELTEIASKIYEKQRTALLVDLKNSQSGIANPSKDLSTLNDNELNEMRTRTWMNKLGSVNPDLISDLQDKTDERSREWKDTPDSKVAEGEINNQLGLLKKIMTIKWLENNQLADDIIKDIKASNNDNSFDRIINNKEKQSEFYSELNRNLRWSNFSNVEDIKLAINNTANLYRQSINWQDPERAVKHIMPIVFRSISDFIEKYNEQQVPVEKKNEEPKKELENNPPVNQEVPVEETPVEETEIKNEW